MLPEIHTRPGAIRGQAPTQAPIEVTNVVAVSDLLGMVETEPGAIQIPAPITAPLVITNVTEGVGGGRPAALIAETTQSQPSTALEPLDEESLGIIDPGDDSGRLFIYHPIGIVWSVDPATGVSELLLDLRDGLRGPSGQDPRGLLAFEVHPDFARHPFVYTYTAEPVSEPADSEAASEHVIAEWRVGPGNTVDLTSYREILRSHTLD